MMKVRSGWWFALVMVGTMSSLGAEDLASTLPADTVAYVQIDLKRLTDEGDRYLRFLDEELAAGIGYQVQELYRIFQDVLQGREIDPALLERLRQAKAYLVVMAMKEPRRVERPFTYQRWDAEKEEYVPTRIDEAKVTETERYTVSLVFETDHETPVKVLETALTYLARKREQNDRAKDFEYREIEVERGRLISDPAGETFLGVFGPYLILSYLAPKELWAALLASPDPVLTSTAPYRRFAEANPLCLGLLDIAGFVRRKEEDLRKALLEAEKKVRASGEAVPFEEGEEDEDNEEGGFQRVPVPQIELLRARSDLQSFLTFKQLLSLDKIRTIAGNLCVAISPHEMTQELRWGLYLDEGFSPILRQVFDGGSRLQPPPLDIPEELTIMARLGIQEIYQEVMKGLDPQTLQAIQMMMTMMKMQMGYDVADLLPHLAGDFYCFLDYEKGEDYKREWNREKQTFEAVKVAAAVPKLFILFGLNDPEAFATTFSNIFTYLSRNEEATRFIKKRVYLGTDIYLVGEDVGAEDAQPDGLTSFAVVAAGRYLSFGSWEHVTELVRSYKAGTVAKNALSEIAAQYPKANFLTVIPKAFLVKLRELQNDVKRETKDPSLSQEIRKQIREEITPLFASSELSNRFTEALDKLLEGIERLSVKVEGLIPSYVILRGELHGTLYEVVGKETLKK